MSIYEDRLTEADFPARVAQIRERLDQINHDDAAAIAGTGQPDLLERLQAVLDHTLVVTGVAKPALVSGIRVQELEQALETVFSSLGGMIHNPHPSDVRILAEDTEALVDVLGKWSGLDDVSQVTDAATSYRRSLGQQLTSAKSELSELKSTLGAVRDQLSAFERRSEEISERIDIANSNYTTRLDQQLETIGDRVDAATDQVDQALRRLDSSIARFQDQFSTAQDTRSTEFQEQIRELQRHTDSVLTEFRTSADQAVDAIREQQRESGDLVSVFAAAGTANAYGVEATSQGKIADRWRLAAIVLALFTAMVAAALLVVDQEKISGLVGHILLTIALGGIAAYAAKQSARHRRREELARHRELDIVAFGPFIRDLEPTQQAKARLDLVDRIFGQDSVLPQIDDTVVTNEHINLLSRLADVLLKDR